ncbi:MAG TPA: c-type cytochrome [Rhodoblastus sp.]|nr:c-type cytochrome [Rhodoblastus sp.]
MWGIGGRYFAVAAVAALLGAGLAAHAENAKDSAAPQQKSPPSQLTVPASPPKESAPPPGAVPRKAFEEKLAYCKTCHGVSGQGFRGALPMPRLAGQQPDYIKNQLQAFIEKRRTNPVMSNVAHVLSPEMVNELSEAFYKLDPPPLGGAPKGLAAEGKMIFEKGVESANIPPCASCHGDDAKGNGEFPRLAGQLNDYVIRKLTNFEKERGQNPAHPDTSAIMKPIAHDLTPQQIAAVAAYVSELR